MGVAADLCAGTLSGSSASLAGQPLDVLRVRAQSRGGTAVSWALRTARAEGVRGFFRGGLPPLLGMGPKNAVGFAAHGAALRVLEGSPAAEPLRTVKARAAAANVCLAGCAAGLAQCVVVVPADRIKCQLQVDGIGLDGKGSGRAGSPIAAVRRLAAAEGWRAALFR